MLPQHKSQGRKAVIDGIKYAFVKGFDVAVQLALLPLVTRAVSVEVFARLALMVIGGQIVVAVLDLGTGMAVIRKLASGDESGRSLPVIATLFWSRLGLAVLAALLLVAVSPQFAQHWQLPLRIGALGLGCWTLFLAVSDVLRARGQHDAVVLGNGLRTVLWGAACYALVIRSGHGLAGLIAAYTVGYAGALCFALSRLGFRVLTCRPRWRQFLSLLRFGMPVGAYIVMRMTWGLDRYLVRHRADLASAGLYQLANAPTAALEALESVWIQSAEPYVYGADSAERDDVLASVVFQFGVAACALSLGLSLLGPELLQILGPASYAPALVAVPWLTCAAAARGIAYLVGFAGGARDQTRVWAISGATELSVALFGLWWVLPSLALAGAIRFAGTLCSLGVCYALVRRLLERRFPVLELGLALTIGTVTAVALATPTWGMQASLPIRLALALALMAISAGLSMRWFRRAAAVRADRARRTPLDADS